MLSSATQSAWLAEIDGEAVGYIAAEIVRRGETVWHHPGAQVHIHQIGVKATHRRGGIGRRLIETVVAHGRWLGVELVTLDAWTFNDTALAFFGSCGLVPFSVRLWNRKGVDEIG